MNVALYGRVSTKDKGQDTENQLSQLRAFAATQGWTIAHEYVDRATGKHSDREQFQRLFADASQRKFDLVLFWSLDRFSREGVLETLNHLQRLAAYGVGYRSFTEQYLDSCGIFKDAVLSILATIAKQERIRLSERTIAGLEKARKQGASAAGRGLWSIGTGWPSSTRRAGPPGRLAKRWEFPRRVSADSEGPPAGRAVQTRKPAATIGRCELGLGTAQSRFHPATFDPRRQPPLLVRQSRCP